MPAAHAASSACAAASSLTGSDRPPKRAPPKTIWDTRRPVLPSGTWCMSDAVTGSEVTDGQQHVRVEAVVAGRHAHREVRLAAGGVELQPAQRLQRQAVPEQFAVSAEHFRR